MDGPLVKIEMTAEREISVTQNGRPARHRTTTTQIAPGESLFYILDVRNIGKGPAMNVVVDNPMPDGAVYVSNSAKGKSDKTIVSTDGGTSFIEEHNGLLPETVTNIRWEIARMPPGGRRRLEFEVKVVPRESMFVLRWLLGFYSWLVATLSK